MKRGERRTFKKMRMGRGNEEGGKIKWQSRKRM
jgi:hypothetical protein